MPSPILKAIFRNFFLEAGLNAFLEKVGINFRLGPISPKGERYTGLIQKGMHFKWIVHKNRITTLRDSDEEFPDATIMFTGRDKFGMNYIHFNYHPDYSHGLTVVRYMYEVDFYI